MSDGQVSRAQWIESMKKLHSRGIDCSHCTGACCTSKYNSMQITIEEAQTISVYISEQNRAVETRKALLDCIRDYRLDQELPKFSGRASLLRTYTCPFYAGHSLGCTLPVTIKPVGCLAFNPTEPKANDSLGTCATSSRYTTQPDSLSKPSEREAIPLAVLKTLDLRREFLP